MSVPAHLTAKMDGLSAESLLADWRQLVPTTYTPVVMTALGDLFLRDEAGRIHFLDLMCGELKQVAISQEEFDGLCESREQRQSWFVSHLVMELRKLHGELPAGRCFSCKVPLSLGGQLDADDFQPCDIQVHYSVLGQLHAQTRHLPPGTKVDSITTESRDEDTTQKRSWWRRVFGSVA